MSTHLIPCAYALCAREFLCTTSRLHRAQKGQAPLYCSRACAGKGRRCTSPPTSEERKAAKRRYDAARRTQKHKEICAQKRQHYHDNRQRIRAEQRLWRQTPTRKQYHRQYCQQPAYRAAKTAYDRRYRAVRDYGPFAEAFLTLIALEADIAARATRYEIYQANGLLNKSQQRKRAHK